VSSTPAATPGRTRILEAALDLITRRGGADVSMAEIAKAARLSRQAVYLHFADRADLFVALAQFTDERHALEIDVRKIVEAPSGVAALRELVALHARMNPTLWPIARAFEAVRRADAVAEQGWRDRAEHQLEGARQAIARLRAEGVLRAGLEPGAAADLLWSLTSLRVWEDLVIVRGWSEERYRRYITMLVVGALTT
jgi:AcrR family transcriptional regulator